MKIAVIGNMRHFNLEEYSVKALRNLGHEVKFLGFNDISRKKYSEFTRILSTRSAIFRKFSEPFWLNKINEEYLLSLMKFRPDIILSIKGESILPKTLKHISNELESKTALWYPDDPRFFHSLVKYIAPEYDHIFTYSSKGIENYLSIGIENPQRLSFGCDNEIHHRENWDNEPLKKALFVGTFTPKRFRILRRLIKNGIEVDIAGKYWRNFLSSNVISNGAYGNQLVNLIQKYKVVINIHNNLNYGPNMRTFEVTGSGGLLLSDLSEDTDSFFINGKEALFYQDINEMISLIKEINSSDQSLMEIAKNGYLKCHNSYPYTQIMKTFMKAMNEDLGRRNGITPHHPGSLTQC